MTGVAVFSAAGLLLALAAFVTGVIDAVSGGGGLVQLPAFLAVGFPAHYIMGTSQTSIIPGALLATVQFAREGKIHWPSALICVPACIVGALLGARLNMVTPEDVLKLIMVVLVPVVAVFVLAKKSFGQENRVGTLSRARLVVTNVLIGLTVGAYQGFYGAGAGTFFLMAFALADRLDLLTASGNGKVVMLASSVSASVAYLSEGLVAWEFVALMVAFNTAGAFVGARLALTRGAKVIRPMFLVILTLLFVRLVWDLAA